MRVGIIGLGGAGLVHLDAWGKVPDAAVVAIADPAPAAQQLARDRGIAAYESARELLARADVDAVSICAPPAQHPGATLLSLARGVDVLCEKPLAVHGGAAMRMLEAAERTRRHLVLATKFRHVPDVVAARDLLASGAIGEPVTFEVAFESRVDMRHRWNARRAVAGGGVIIDNGCHAFDVVSFLFGAVTRVQAIRLRNVQAIGVEDSATVLAGVGRNLVGRIDLSWSLTPSRTTYVVIRGERGSIELGWGGSVLKVHGRDPEPFGSGYSKAGCHVAMLRAFRAVVAGEIPSWITAGECLRTVAAVEAAYHSLDWGAWVPVDTLGVCEEASRRDLAPRRRALA